MTYCLDYTLMLNVNSPEHQRSANGMPDNQESQSLGGPLTSSDIHEGFHRLETSCAGKPQGAYALTISTYGRRE